MSVKAVLITGRMRSGTSLVAQIVHRLGFHVAPTIPAPASPSWRSDWEDPYLTGRLISRTPVEWPFYVANRKAVAKKLGFRGYAIKSPYLALVWDKVVAAAGDACHIVVSRDEETRQRSLEQYPALSREDDRAIIASMPCTAHFFLQYERLIEYADIEIPRLARALGVTDQETIDAAGRLVGMPTEYATCPL